jgi:16S rRNA (adenine1518-N6/adenine1519-N6)-dimethyltransferase
MEYNITSPKAVKQILEEYSLAPLKRLGQNFLVDGNIAGKIAEEAVPAEGACVIEIGPGLGALTERLIKRAKNVMAYEIDSGLTRALGSIFASADNLDIIHKDFLKADMESDIGSYSKEGIYAAANLPYYITTPCIMKLIESNLNIKRITVLVQKEVAEKICASPGDKDYCALSAAVSLCSHPEIKFTVPSSCFYPSPEVSSSLLTMEMNDIGYEEKHGCLELIKSLFSMRRKTVKSNLRQVLKLSREDSERILQYLGIDENARAETLGVIDFRNLYREIMNLS